MQKSINYLLTLHMYKTCLVIEKSIPRTIIPRRCLNYSEVTLIENEMNRTPWLYLLLTSVLTS